MRELKTNDKGQDVVTLKTWLNKYEFRDDPGKALNVKSDLFDASTRQALKRFQRKIGLIDTGIFDSKTQTLLPNYNLVTT